MASVLASVSPHDTHREHRDFDDNHRGGNSSDSQLSRHGTRSNLDHLSKEEAAIRDFVPTTFLQKVFMRFEDPMYDRLAKVISTTIASLIVLSVFTFVMETMPKFQNVPGKCDFGNPRRKDCRRVPKPVFWQIESCCMIIFTVEYAIRILSVHTVPEFVWRGSDAAGWPGGVRLTYRYVVRWMNMIDLAAILPYWIEVIGGIESSFSVLRIVRLTRMLRMLKSRSVRALVQVIGIALRESAPALLILLFFSIMAIVLVGTLEFIFEHGRWSISEDDLGYCCSAADIAAGDRKRCLGCFIRPTTDGLGREASPFQSIPMGMYYVIVTMMTVGYGDVVPTTSAGRIIAVATTYFGIVGLALPISVIGNNFTRAYEDFRDEQRKLRAVREGTDAKSRLRHNFKRVLKGVRIKNVLRGPGSATGIDGGDSGGAPEAKVHAEGTGGDDGKPDGDNPPRERNTEDASSSSKPTTRRATSSATATSSSSASSSSSSLRRSLPRDSSSDAPRRGRPSAPVDRMRQRQREREAAEALENDLNAKLARNGSFDQTSSRASLASTTSSRALLDDDLVAMFDMILDQQTNIKPELVDLKDTLATLTKVIANQQSSLANLETELATSRSTIAALQVSLQQGGDGSGTVGQQKRPTAT